MVGGGKLGARCAALLVERGFDVTVARRNATASTLPSMSVDVREPDTLTVLEQCDWTLVVIALTADEFSESAYQATYVEGVGNVLAELERGGQGQLGPLVLFVSSTSIYGQQQGEWVDESSEILPGGFSGRAMQAAEQRLRESPLPTCSLRLGGIYGGGANRLLQRAASGLLLPKEPVRYSNRIHVDDAAAAMIFVAQAHGGGSQLASCYNVVDDNPAPLHEVELWLAQQQGVGKEAVSEDASGGRAGSKRCSNAALKALGFQLRYPDYKSGYSAILASAES